MLENIRASLLLAILLMKERYTGLPMLLALANRIRPSIAGRMAYMYFAFNLAIVVVARS
jgi:hypothetical protein